MAEEKKKPAKRGRRKKEEVELEEKKEPAKRGRRKKVEVETEEVELIDAATAQKLSHTCW